MTREERAKSAILRLSEADPMAIQSFTLDDLLREFLAFADAEAAAMRERAAGVAEDRTPVVQCMSVEPIVSACNDIAAAIRALPATGEVGRG